MRYLKQENLGSSNISLLGWASIRSLALCSHKASDLVDTHPNRERNEKNGCDFCQEFADKKEIIVKNLGGFVTFSTTIKKIDVEV